MSAKHHSSRKALWTSSPVHRLVVAGSLGVATAVLVAWTVKSLAPPVEVSMAGRLNADNCGIEFAGGEITRVAGALDGSLSGRLALRVFIGEVPVGCLGREYRTKVISNSVSEALSVLGPVRYKPSIDAAGMVLDYSEQIAGEYARR